MIQDDARLDAGDAACRIDLEDIGHVLRKIEDDRDVAALSGERGSSAAAKKRRAKFTAERDGGEDVVSIARENDSDGNLAVVGSVSGVEGATLIVEADIATEVFTQGFGQSQGIGERRLWGWCDVFEYVVHGPVEQNDYFFATVLIWNFEPLPLDSTLMVVTLGGAVETMVQRFSSEVLTFALGNLAL